MMTPQSKLRIANILMLAGILPLLFGIYWMISRTPYDMQRPTQVGDMFLMIGKLVFAYIFALIISGASGLWSAAIAKRHPGTQANTSKIIRIVVCIVLIVPVVLRVLAG